MRIQETCGCGAKVTIDEQMTGYANLAAGKWREQHACTVVPPGPCAHDPGIVWPTGIKVRCELRAGHDGAHECDRDSMGGTSAWGETDLDEAEQRAERAEREWSQLERRLDAQRGPHRCCKCCPDDDPDWHAENEANTHDVSCPTCDRDLDQQRERAERAEAELAALQERVRDRAWAFDAMGKHAHANDLRHLLDDDTTGAASGEGEK